MGNYEQLKQSVSDVIKTNGNQEITGSILQNVLLTIISTVGANATFAGIATPTTNPGTPDGSVFWLASESGTYTNFNAIELQDGLSALMWNGSWSSQQILSIDNEPTAGSDNLVKSGGVQEELALGAVYDVSAKNPTAGVNNDGKWESLSVLLSDTNLNTLIPTPVRKGGMSIKFIQSSDNKYVQYRCKTQSFSTDPEDWAVETNDTLIDNPEFLVLFTDKNKQILFGFQKNGNFLFGGGVPIQIQDAIKTAINNCKADIQILIDSLNSSISDINDDISDINERCPRLINNPEWLYVIVDSNNRIVEGYRRDNVYVNYYIPETYQEFVQNTVSSAIQALGIQDILNSLQKRENESKMLGFDEELTIINLEIIDKNIALGSVGIGNIVDLTPENVGSYGYVIIPCSFNDVFYISASGGQNPRAYGFVDSNNVLLSMAPANAIYNMKKVVAPIGAAKLIINSRIATTSIKGNGLTIERVDSLYEKYYYDVFNTPDDVIKAYVNGLQFTKELTNPIADLTKDGDKMVHVSTFKIINGKIYATYYVNRIGTGETPSEHLARFVICDLAYPTDIQFYDVGFTVNSKSNDTPDDLWHINGNEVTALYDTILLTIDDNTLFILWTAQAGGNYYRIYRTYNITTGEFSDVQLNYYKVGNDTAVFNSANMIALYAANNIKHREFASDIGLMQKLSSRVENGVTYYYSGIYYYAHTAIVKTTDLITWEFVSSPDFVWPYADILWENAVYLKNDKVYYMQRQKDHDNFGILAYYDLNLLEWSNPIRVHEAQSRYDFIEFDNKLLCVHSPKDRSHIAIMQINTNQLNRSYDIQVAQVPDYFYPFMQTYNNELYMSFTASRRHIYLSKVTVGSISANSINTVFKAMFNI